MTSAYVDTGLLMKLYTHETNSDTVVQLVRDYPAPLPLTEWQESELKNALRLKVFRREIDAVSLQSSLDHLAADLSTGWWLRPAYVYSDLFQRAESFSHGYAAIIGCRTLDILHVAAASIIGARDFLTSDARQAGLAKQVGLIVRSV